MRGGFGGAKMLFGQRIKSNICTPHGTAVTWVGRWSGRERNEPAILHAHKQQNFLLISKLHSASKCY